MELISATYWHSVVRRRETAFIVLLDFEIFFQGSSKTRRCHYRVSWVYACAASVLQSRGPSTVM